MFLGDRGTDILSNKKVLLITIAIVILSIFCSCTFESDTSRVTDLTTVTTTGSESSELATNNENCRFEIKSIKTKSPTEVVQVLIPQLSSAEDIDYLDVNKLIYDEVVQYLSHFQVDYLYLSDDSTVWSWDKYECESTVLAGEYSIKCCDEEKISVLFFGQINYKSSSHPERYSFTININKEDNRLIDVHSMYNFDMKLVELVRKNESDWLVRKEQKEVLDSLSDSQLFIELTNSEKTYYYLTQNKVGIVICNLPYVAGNYCVIEVPINEMTGSKQ